MKRAGKRIDDARKELGLSIAEFMRRLGRDATLYHAWRKGQKWPAQSWGRIQNVTGHPLEWFVGGAPASPVPSRRPTVDEATRLPVWKMLTPQEQREFLSIEWGSYVPSVAELEAFLKQHVLERLASRKSSA